MTLRRLEVELLELKGQLVQALKDPSARLADTYNFVRGRVHELGLTATPEFCLDTSVFPTALADDTGLPGVVESVARQMIGLLDAALRELARLDHD